MASRQRRGRTPGAVLAVVSLALAGTMLAAAQTREFPAVNPLAGDATAIKQGQNMYRGQCAVCHGIDAKGYRGSDLTTGDWVHGGADPQIAKTIAEGVPGTEMPGHRDLSDDEVWMLVAYLRTLSAPGGPAVDRGDASRGEQLFWAAGGANCGRCHMVGGRGGRLGPVLSAHRCVALGGRPRTGDPAAGRGHPRRLRDDHRHHRPTARRFAACARTRTPSRCR